MNKKILAFSITVLCSISTGMLHAKGNIRVGKEKSAACSGCHGETGNSVMPLFPKLAGQHPKYLVKQLIAFKDGSRNDATMAPMVLALTEKDFVDLAEYYAAQKISANTKPVLNDGEDDDDEEENKAAENIDELLAQGRDLYRNGNRESEVSACIACHGPYGEGNKPAAFPALKSQHADYLIKTLNDFKSGARTKNPDNIMHMIAKKMTETEIRAVAYHISMMK